VGGVEIVGESAIVIAGPSTVAVKKHHSQGGVARFLNGGLNIGQSVGFWKQGTEKGKRRTQ